MCKRLETLGADAKAKWLTGKDRELLGGPRYRLPTRDEFTVFAQCGDGREYPWDDNLPPLNGQAGNYASEETNQPLDFNVIDGRCDGQALICDVEKSWNNPWGLYGVGGNI